MKVAHLSRKPISREAGTVGKNVLVYGTGGINIDAGRIRYVSKEDMTLVPGRGEGSLNPGCGVNLPGYKANWQDWQPKDGRWPANTILLHKPGCVCVGSKSVKGITGTAAGKMAGNPDGIAYGLRQKDGTSRWSGSAAAGSQTGFVNLDGTETVDAWECEEGCAVRELDAQSGIQRSGIAVQRNGGASHRRKILRNICWLQRFGP